VLITFRKIFSKNTDEHIKKLIVYLSNIYKNNL